MRGLETIHERPNHRRGRGGGSRCGRNRFAAAARVSHYIFPADFAAIYDLASAYQQGINGAGQTIAIISRARVYLPDIENFQTLAGLPAKDPTIIVPPGGSDPGAALSSGGSPSGRPARSDYRCFACHRRARPGRTIDLVADNGSPTENGLAVAALYVVDAANLRSRTWDEHQFQHLWRGSAGQSGVDFYNDIYSQAVAEGISVFAISGDSGVDGCLPYFSTPPASQVASPNYICVSSYDTCVGGTQFADTSNPTQFWRTSNTSAFESAIGYIPEGAWNEPLNGAGNPQTAASGGGVSQFIPTPSWQRGNGVPGTAGRYTPDVSFSASAHDGYFACLAAAGSPCVRDSSGNFMFEYFFGTSASTPNMAGVAALLGQKFGGPQGNLNPRLYALAADIRAEACGEHGDADDRTWLAAFRIATSPCRACTATTPTPGPSGLSGSLTGYLVGVGYDRGDRTRLDRRRQSAGELERGANGRRESRSIRHHRFLVRPGDERAGIRSQRHPGFKWTRPGFLFRRMVHLRCHCCGRAPLVRRARQCEQHRWACRATRFYDVEGGNFDAPPRVGAHAVLGTATFSLSDCSTGIFTYQFTNGSGRAGTIPLTRIAPNVTCAASGDNGAPHSDYLLSGSWYNPATSGQGFLIDINPDINLFSSAWYTFILNGASVGGAASQNWFTLQSASFVNGATSLPGIAIIETSGGAFDNPAHVTRAQVGTANIVFHSCTTLSLTYTFNGGANAGLSGSIDLQRIIAAPAGCSL